MSRRSRKSGKRQRIKATSIMPMSLTAGFFLGIGLGALMNQMLLLILTGLVIGGGFGYYVDKRNRVPYTRRKKT